MAQLRAIKDWFRPRRRLTLGALVLWSLIIAAAAGESSDDDRWLSLPDLSWIAAVALLSFAVGGLVFILLFKPPFEPRSVFRPFRGIGSLILVTAVCVAILISFDESVLLPPPEEAVPGIAGEPGISDDTDQPDAGATLGEAILLGIVALAAIGLVAWSRRNESESSEESEFETEDPRLRALEDASQILEAERDPRRAVLLAYAALEHELTAIGLARDSVETPTEHLRRVLADRPLLVGPATHLGDLYLIARYSVLPILPQDRDSARTALDRATSDLRAGTVTA